jgi:hypothetical protein
VARRAPRFGANVVARPGVRKEGLRAWRDEIEFGQGAAARRAREHGDEVRRDAGAVAHGEVKGFWRGAVGRPGFENVHRDRAVAAKFRGGPEPESGNVEDDLAAASEGDPAGGDDQPGSEVRAIADDAYLTFPDNAVGLEIAPSFAARTAYERRVAARIAMVGAVVHALSLRGRRFTI